MQWIWFGLDVSKIVAKTNFKTIEDWNQKESKTFGSLNILLTITPGVKKVLKNIIF